MKTLGLSPHRDAESVLQNDLTRQSVDALLYYLFDVELSQEDREFVKQTILSKKPVYTHRISNNELVTSDFCQRYAQLRALGMSQRDTAYMMGVSVARLESILRGEDLKEKKYEMLLLAEGTGDAALKDRCLRTIDKAIGDGNWKAAMTLLEKKFPKEYGRRLEVNSNAAVRWSAEECESAAAKAQTDLERIRAERNEHGLTEEDLYMEAGTEGEQS